MKESFEKRPYQGSPLESILTKILEKIRQLKEKHSKVSLHSFKQIQAIEQVVRVFNEEILPRFDNKTPGIIDMLAIGKQIRDFDEALGETFYSLATPKALIFGHAINTFSQMVWPYIQGNTDENSLTNKKVAKKLDLKQKEFMLEAKKLPNQHFSVESLDDEFAEVKKSLLGLNINNFLPELLGEGNIVVPLLLNMFSQLFTNINKMAAFTIDNPMFFELVVYLTELIDQAPETLQEIIPFFKPESIITQPVEIMLGKDNAITHKKNLEYKIGKLSIDLSALYAISYPTFNEIIFSAIASYMKQHPDDVLVTTALSQSQSLHDDVQKESTSIQRKVKLHTKNCILTSTEDLDGLALVQTIDEQIKYNALLLSENGELQKELKSQLTKQRPSKVVGWNEEKNALVVIPIQEKLDGVINEQMHRLKQCVRTLNKQEEKLKCSRQQALVQWKQLEQQKQLQYLENLLFEQQDALENYKKESIPDSEQQNTLDGDIEWLEQRSLALKSLKIELSNCLIKARQSTKLPKESILYDYSCTLQNTLTEEFKSFEQKIVNINEYIAIASEQVQNQLRQKEQDKFEAVRKECLGSEDIGKIQEALSKYTADKFILEKKSDGLSCSLEKKISELKNNVPTLNALMSCHNEQQKALEQSVKATHESMVETFKIIRTYLKSCLPLDTQGLKNDLNVCMKWIQTSYRFVETKLKLENKNKLQAPLLYLDRVTIYSSMKRILDESPTNRLPFAELETLILDTLFDDNVPQTTGFANVLQCLGIQEYKQKFIDYRDKQESWYRIAPTQDETTYLLNLLIEKIKLKSDEQKQHYRMVMSCEALSTLEDDLKITMTKQSDFDSTQSKYDELVKDIQILESEQMELTTQLGELKKQGEVLNQTQYILQSKITLLEGINLQDAVLSLLKEKKDFLALNPLIFEMQNMQSQLINKVNQLEKCTDVKTFRIRVESIEHNMRSIIKYHFDAIKLHERLGTNLRCYNELKEKGLEHIVKNNIFEDYIQLSESMMAFQYLFKQVGDIVIRLDNSCYVDTMVSIEELTRQLHDNMKEFGCSVLEQLMNELAEQLTKANVFKSLEFPEHSQQTPLNETIFSEVENDLKRFNGISVFNKSVAFYSKDEPLITQVINEIEKVDTQSKDSRMLNQDLVGRIANRHNLVDMWLNKLDGLLTIHGGQYEAFIQELKLKMTTFKDVGCSAEVHKAIDDKQKTIPQAYQIQRSLNQLKLALVDSDRQIPRAYQVVEPIDYSALAGELLRDHTNESYVTKMTYMRTQIGVLTDFGVTLPHALDRQHIATLVAKLTEDLDYFIVQQGAATPSTEQQQKFAELFTVRLHSKDEELSERRDTWKLVFPILVNIAIGVVTLGIAIGIKLIHSKVTTDKFSFFCEKTSRVDQINVTDESIQQALMVSA